jgi:hypothetical protein
MMDPIGILFGAYLDSVANMTHRHVQESLGTEIQAERIDYEGTLVDFQYQLWQVRHPSVCASRRGDLREFSACTIKAQAMFRELCDSLALTEAGDWRVSKARNMYCNAAVSFRPTQASISAAEQSDELARARQRCNVAISAALGSGDRKAIAERDKACAELAELQAARSRD